MIKMAKANRFKITFKGVLIIFLLFAVLAESVAVHYLFREYGRQKRAIAERDATIKELQERLMLINAIEQYQRGLTSGEVIQVADIIYEESKRYMFDPYLILALIVTESSFRKHQVSEYGAMGLMQLMPSTAQAVARKNGIDLLDGIDLYNPVLNVRLGVNYLFDLILKFKSLKQGLLAYNMGESLVIEYNYYNAEPPLGFYHRVIDNYRDLKSRYGEASIQ